jgi:hypothetical protein
MPDAVYNWPVTCACRADRGSVEFAQVHEGRDGSVECGPSGRRQYSDQLGERLTGYAPAVSKAVPAGGRERGERRAPVEGIAVPLDVSGPLKSGDHLGH